MPHLRPDPTLPDKTLATVDEIVAAFELSPEHVRKVTRHFVEQMRHGLKNAEMPYQLPAFVTKVPDGSEKGAFLSVDLGGTNCRICLIDLHGDGTLSVTQTKHVVPTEVMVNESYEPLFTWIAAKVAEFLDSQKLGELNHATTQPLNEARAQKRIPLGFTFSFTVNQTSLERGTLITWDKGWDIPAAIGKDPCAMLQEAVDARGLPVLVSALANDSVGTLLARAYTSRARRNQLGNGAGVQDAGRTASAAATMAGVIIGTGTNAAYVERLANIERLAPEHQSVGADIANNDKIMIINTEWGGFDDTMDVLPRTPFDDDLDRQSTEPGAQMMEKRVSGMYLGELFRLVVLHLCQAAPPREIDLTLEEDSPVFRRDGVDCELLSHLVDDKFAVEAKMAEVAMVLHARSVSDRDIGTLARVAEAIGLRAARLAGASLAAVIIQSGRIKHAEHDAATAERVRSPVSLPSASSSTTAKSKVNETGATARVEECPPPMNSVEEKSTNSGRLCGLPILRLWRNFLGMLGYPEAPSPVTTPPPNATNEERVAGEDSEAEGDIIDIGVDGSVIEFFPGFEANMRAAMRDVPEIGPASESRIRIGITQYGSAVGAALMAQASLVQGTTGA